MKKYFPFLLLLLLACGTLVAQSPANTGAEAAPAATEEVTGGAIMTFEVGTIDYGTIEHNADPLRVFKFTNTGDAPLKITSAKGSCGCTVPKYPHDEIAPGESGEIEVRYDTKRIGNFAKNVTLTTNATNSNSNLAPGMFRLNIKGKVNAPAPQEVAPVQDATPVTVPENHDGHNHN